MLFLVCIFILGKWAVWDNKLELIFLSTHTRMRANTRTLCCNLTFSKQNISHGNTIKREFRDLKHSVSSNNFSRCFTWLWNLASHLEDKCIFWVNTTSWWGEYSAKEVGSKRRLELLKTYTSSKSRVIKPRGMIWVNRGAQRERITAT
jgi:hypothetical protein